MKNHLKVNNKISLHLPNVAQAAELFTVIDKNREHLSEWLDWVDKTTKEEDSRRFLKEAALFAIGGQRLTTLIYFEDQLIGAIGFPKISKKHHSAEMGYWISKDWQGKGIIIRAAYRLIKYGFNSLELNRIVIKVMPHNQRSLAIPNRLGFQKEGVLRAEVFSKGQYHDLMVFSLLKDEFQVLPQYSNR